MKQLAFMLAAVAVGCGDLPEPTVGGTQAPSSQTQTRPLKPEPPDILTHSTTFGYASIPRRGKAEKNTTIIVDGGAAPTATDTLATGSFCVDVALKAGRNNLKVYAQRIDDGAKSDAEPYTVTFDSSIAEDDPVVTPPPTGTVRDVAQRKAVSSTVAAAAGNANITDGDDGTYAAFEAYPALYIDLGSSHAVEKIDIVWSAGSAASGRYADEYDVISSLQTAPSMDGSTNGWSTVASVTGVSGGNGDAGTDSFTFGTPISARWVGLVVNHNATGWWSPDWGVEIASIRVFAPEVFTGGGTGTVGPPTCENGN